MNTPPPIMDDANALAAWAAERSTTAFDALVRRHVDFVYAAAIRELRGDAAGAEDVTQAVFLVLARKAETIRRGSSLPAWLHQTTRYAVANVRKMNARRTKHERAASQSEAVMPLDASEFDPLLPLLDEAIAALPAKDRAVIISRYLQGRDLSTVADELATTVPAAQKRLERAVVKLRTFFASRGVMTPASAVAISLAATNTTTAPPGLAASIASAATAQTAATASVVSIAKGVTHMMTWMQLKFAAVAAIVVLATGTAGVEVTKLALADPAPPSAVPASPTTAPAGTFIATLRDGTTCELVAVGEQSTGQWWRPDGTPTEAPYPSRDYIKDDLSPADIKPGMRYLYLVTRTVTPHGTPTTQTNRFNNDYTVKVGIGVSNRGKAYNTQLIEVSPDLATTSHDVAIASQPTDMPCKIVIANAGGEAIDQLSNEYHLKQGGTLNITALEEKNGKTQFIASWPQAVPTLAVEPALVTKEGKMVSYSSYTHLPPVPQQRPQNLVVFDHPFAQVAEAGLRVTRWDELVDFSNISLWPNVVTAPRVDTTDNPDFVVKLGMIRRLPELRFDAVGLSDTIDFLRDVTGTKIVTDWNAIEKAGIDRNTPISTRMRDRPFDECLQTILNQVGGKVKLAWTIRNGGIVIAPAAATAQP